MVLLLLRLLVLLSPESSPTLTQPLRCGPMPPSLLPASHIPNLYSNERAKLGSFPDIGHNSVTPKRCAPPPEKNRATPSAPRGGRLHTTTR